MGSATAEVQPSPARFGGATTRRGAYRSGMGRKRARGGRDLLLRIAIIGTLAGDAGGATAAAATSSAGIVVGATVRASARVLSAEPPASLVVTPQDVERGYVDVALGGRWRVSTNADVYSVVVDLAGAAGIVAVEVDGVAQTTRTLAPPRGMLRRRRGPSAVETLEPRWRFHLADGATPGPRPWPLRLTVRP